jgi:hypothetical protein
MKRRMMLIAVLVPVLGIVLLVVRAELARGGAECGYSRR